MRGSPIFLFFALVLAQSAFAVTDAERTQVYQEFRSVFDARKYAEARPIAEKLVALTEEQYGAKDRALVNPLTNVATTAYRMKDYKVAEANYLRAIQILEAAAGQTDRQLLRPLQGLGVTYAAEQQYDDAALLLKRAIDLSRNLDGLFNAEQLQYLDPLISTYIALERNADVEKEQQYRLNVAESAYGKTDVRLLEPLDQYASWLESVGRYTSARALYGRALAIAEKSGGRNNVLEVRPLQGVARTYRLEFLNGAEPVPEHPSTFDSGLRPQSSDPERLNPEGEHALRIAMQAIDSATPVDHKLRGETLIEFGDWNMSSGAASKGIENYSEAWQELSQVNATTPLETPRLIAYRPPVSSIKRSTLNPESAELHYVEVSFTVTKEGRTSGISVVSSDAPDGIQKAVINAVKKARYSPRLADGAPVDTSGVSLRERVLLRKQEPKKS